MSANTLQCTVVMTQARSVTATFVRQYELILYAVPGQGGTVGFSPAGRTPVACIPLLGVICPGLYDEGTQVSLTVQAAPGYAFSAWSGGYSGANPSCLVSMNQDQSVTATFTLLPPQYTLTVSKTGTGSGTVTSSPTGIDCGTTCSASVTAGTTVTLAAAAVPGSTFGGWSGDCNSGGAVEMAGERSCTAVFNRSAARGNGKIVLVNDDWILSDTGFAAPNDAGTFATNIAAWFTGGRPGKFHAYSDHFGLTGSSLAAAMTGAGHTWTTGTAGFTFNLGTLQQHDGIFLLVSPVDNTVLIDYVEAGGNVYLAYSGDPSRLDEQHNAFVAHFGLGLGTINNGLAGNVAISNSHSIFAGVDSLYNVNGSDIAEVASDDPRQSTLVSQDGHGLYAVYEGRGRDAVGTFRPADGTFYLDYNGNGAWDGCSTERCLQIRLDGDAPLVGKW